MKEINVIIKIIDNNKEEKIIKSRGTFDEENNIISFYDDKVLVNVIIGEKIIMQRRHNDYNLDLIFEENKKNNSLYEIKNPKMDIRIEVNTMMLRRCENNFYIEYMLKMNNEDIGLFVVDFKMEE